MRRFGLAVKRLLPQTVDDWIVGLCLAIIFTVVFCFAALAVIVLTNGHVHAP